jgi:hypothetical protein
MLTRATGLGAIGCSTTKSKPKLYLRPVTKNKGN